MSPDQVLSFLYGVVQAIWGDTAVKIITFQIAFNFVVAIAAAIAIGEFKWHKLIEVFYRKLLPLVMVYAAARVIGGALSGVEPNNFFDAFLQLLMQGLPVGSLFAIEALLLKDLLNSLAMIPGLENIVDAVPSKLADTVFDRETYLVARENRRARDKGPLKGY
jgi:hypothetical protein